MDLRFQNAMQLYNLAWLVSDLQDEKHDDIAELSVFLSRVYRRGGKRA